MANRSEKKFAWDICGHERIAAFLQSAIASNKLSHAYLFIGPAGVGKYALARQFIKSIFCLRGDQLSPCGQCSNCLQLERGTHPDVYLVKRQIDDDTGKWKKDIIINQIRELKQKLQQTTLLSGYKAALIPEAQLVNYNAYSSLLKILEEPTAKTIIILSSDDPEKIPATIVSRCQIINFLPVAGEILENYLNQLGAPEEKIRLLSRLAHGLPGRAINLLKDEELLEQLQFNLKLFLDIVKDNPNHRLNRLEEIISWEKDEAQNAAKISRLFDDWQAALRDLLLLSQGEEHYAANIIYLKSFLELKEKFDWRRIKLGAALLRQAKESLRQNINSKFVLENLIINL